MVSSVSSGTIDCTTILTLLRIEADREVVERDLEDVGLELFRMLEVVGQRLHVGDQHVGVVFVLQAHAVLQRADVMAEMQRAGRAVAGQNSFLDHQSDVRPLQHQVAQCDEVVGDVLHVGAGLGLEAHRDAEEARIVEQAVGTARCRGGPCRYADGDRRASETA